MKEIGWRYIKQEEKEKYTKMGVPVRVGPKGGLRIPVNSSGKPIQVNNEGSNKYAKIMTINIHDSLETIKESDDLDVIMNKYKSSMNDILSLFDKDNIDLEYVFDITNKLEKVINNKINWLEVEDEPTYKTKIGMRTFELPNLDDSCKERVEKYNELLKDDDKLNEFLSQYSGRYNDLIKDMFENARIDVEIEDSNFEIFDKLENLDMRMKKHLINTFMIYDTVTNNYKRDLKFKISSETIYEGMGYHIPTGENSSRIEIQNKYMGGISFIHCAQHELMHYIDCAILQKADDITEYDEQNFNANMALNLKKIMGGFYRKIYSKYGKIAYAMKNSNEFTCELFPLTISGTGVPEFKKIVRENFDDFKILNKIVKKYMEYGNLIVDE